MFFVLNRRVKQRLKRGIVPKSQAITESAVSVLPKKPLEKAILFISWCNHE